MFISLEKTIRDAVETICIENNFEFTPDKTNLLKDFFKSETSFLIIEICELITQSVVDGYTAYKKEVEEMNRCDVYKEIKYKVLYRLNHSPTYNGGVSKSLVQKEERVAELKKLHSLMAETKAPMAKIKKIEKEIKAIEANKKPTISKEELSVLESVLDKEAFAVLKASL
jgi:hypothetical protein